MGVLYRLRRSVALMICPEMGSEVREKVGFFDLDAARYDCRRRQADPAAPKDPFLPASEYGDLLERLRHSRVERAKKVLKIIHLVEQRGVTEETDPLFDRATQDLADILFGDV